MQWGLVDPFNIVRNIIIYDGHSPYEPPEGLVLTQINDWVQIGQNIDTPKPPPE